MIKKIYSHKFNNEFELYYAKKTESKTITIEIWIRVGACNEDINEHGICHMIEHMMFKGSRDIKVGELDTAFYLIGGQTNAYTSKDFTVYTFSFQEKYIDIVFNILSSLFKYPNFPEEECIPEKQVVLQEIKMYDDMPYSKLMDEAFLNSYSKGNYQHKILGNYQSVLNFSRNQLLDFYKKTYIPKNMKMFITGGISFKKIIELSKKSYFNFFQNPQSLEISVPVKKDSIVGQKQKIKKINTMYFKTSNDHILLTYKLPKCAYASIHTYKALNLILGENDDSLLYKRLNIETNLVSDVYSVLYQLQYDTYLFIYFNPNNSKDLGEIITHINSVMHIFCEGELPSSLLEKVNNIITFDHKSLLIEHYNDFFDTIGSYTFEKKRNFLFFKVDKPDSLKNKIKKITSNLKNQTPIFNGLFNEKNKKNIKKDFLPKKIDKIVESNNLQDTQENIISEKKIPSILEVKQNNQIRIKEQYRIKKKFLENKKNTFPKYAPLYPHKEEVLSNNLTVILAQKKSDLVTIILSLEVDNTYDEKEYLGGINILFSLMEEGTASLKGRKFIEKIKYYGIEFFTSPGHIEITVLKKYTTHAINLLYQYITEPELKERRLGQIKNQIRSSLKDAQDNLSKFSVQEARKKIYKNHQYSYPLKGTLETLPRITIEYIHHLYKKYISPDKSILILVGDLEPLEYAEAVSLFSKWKYKEVKKIIFNKIEQNISNKTEYVDTKKNQAAIIYAGISVKKYSKEYYNLLLGGELLTGGITGSMHSLLFEIREKTGFFYQISGSLVSGCSDEPGLLLIQALTSPEFVNQATEYIDIVIDSFAGMINKTDLYIAKKSLLYKMAEKNSTQNSLAYNLLSKYQYSLSEDDFLKNYEHIKNVSVKEIKKTFLRYFSKKLLQKFIFVNNKN